MIHTGPKLQKILRERTRIVIIDKAIEEAAGEIAWEPCRCEEQKSGRQAGDCARTPAAGGCSESALKRARQERDRIYGTPWRGRFMRRHPNLELGW